MLHLPRQVGNISRALVSVRHLPAPATALIQHLRPFHFAANADQKLLIKSGSEEATIPVRLTFPFKVDNRRVDYDVILDVAAMASTQGGHVRALRVSPLRDGSLGVYASTRCVLKIHASELKLGHIEPIKSWKSCSPLTGRVALKWIQPDPLPCNGVDDGVITGDTKSIHLPAASIRKKGGSHQALATLAIIYCWLKERKSASP